MNIIIIFFGISYVLLIRFLNLPKNSETLITCADCYRYTRFAREIYEGNYSAVDWLKNFPELSNHEFPPPLLSLLAQKTALLTGLSIDTVTFYLPPLLSVLVMIPLYFYLISFANRFVAIASSVMAATGFIYAQRTGFGRFDTDSLILFFVFAVIYFFYRSINSRSVSRAVVFSSVATAVYHIFMWWYPKPQFILFFLAGILLSLILHFRTKELVRSHLIAVSVFIFGTVNYLSNLQIGVYIERIFGKPVTGHVFVLQKYVNELVPVDFSRLINETVSNPIILAISVIGFILFLRNHFREIAISLPIFGLGLLSFTGAGVRMLIYLIPFLGMGFGYALYLLFAILGRNLSKLSNRVPTYVNAFGLIFTAIVSVPPDTYFIKPRLIFPSDVVETAKKTAELYSDRDIFNKPVVWTWWDYGDMIQYYGLPTFTDNANWHIPKLYLLSKSLYAKEEEDAIRIISFTSSTFIGRDDTDYEGLLRKALGYGGRPPREIIVFVTENMLRFEPIHEMAFYPEKLKEFGIGFSFNCFVTGAKSKNYNCGILNINLSDFSFSTSEENARELARYRLITFINRDTGEVVKLSGSENYERNRTVVIVKREDDLFLYDLYFDTYDSVIGRMFFNPKSLKMFTVLEDRFPFAVALKMK